ncbi:TPA: hypothetical protein DD449_04600 [Candidatus Berkelbacteria bacterium]|uniref:Uncharacterized protein n=1 Tax=Berkelbacteria bacterium GW2011_GWE1_39_12 TaxID=1618337 RepID=A0A0G4B442_9BACT|nr:MAG: hypothetical protein UT28_C0001G0540 [Berkelbacteria bacterium GW2011_GWE1_39_12]HBO60935.1 hypothetical protein [Candidatus Berkelbacteria bacterium]
MKNKFFTKRRGVTLMELIIYIGVMSIVIVAITDLAGRLVFAQKKNNASTEINETSNLISGKLNSDIANATAVNGIFPSNTLILTVDGHQLQYDLSDNNLSLKTDSGEAVKLNSSRIKIQPVVPSTMIFNKAENGSANSVSYKMNFTLLTGSGIGNTVQTTILMRAK